MNWYKICIYPDDKAPLGGSPEVYLKAHGPLNCVTQLISLMGMYNVSIKSDRDISLSKTQIKLTNGYSIEVTRCVLKAEAMFVDA